MQEPSTKFELHCSQYPLELILSPTNQVKTILPPALSFLASDEAITLSEWPVVTTFTVVLHDVVLHIYFTELLKYQRQLSAFFMAYNNKQSGRRK